MKRSRIGPKNYEDAKKAATRRAARRLTRQNGKEPRYGVSKKVKKPLGFSGRIKAKAPRPGSRRGVKAELDQLVREIIKLRDWKCFTCPLTQNLQVGHLFRRGIESLRWDLENNHAQCPLCNSEHESDPQPYIRAFVQEYGREAYDELETISRSKHKFTYVELLEIRDELRAELKRYELARKEAV